MAEATRDSSIARSLVLRALVAAVAVLAYSLVQDRLDPRALVTARFGVGIALFALLVDVGRTLVGAGDPVDGDIKPHRQRADPLVDDRYERVHEPVKRYIDESVWTQSYENLLEETFDARSVPEADRHEALERARRAAGGDRMAGPPTTLTLVAGLIAVAGVSLVVGILLEALGQPVTGTVLVFIGVGLALLQVRARDGGARWTALLLGLSGTVAAGFGAVRLARGQVVAATLPIYGLVAVLGGATIVMAVLGPIQPPPWPRIEATLERRFELLRRAFLVALLAGGVLFPFEPLLAELFTALGWPLDVPYRILTIGYATLATYLAVEMAATWYGLSRGRERARQRRRRRVEANRAILDLLERRAPDQREETL